MVTVTVLEATEFCGFYVQVMMLPSLTFRANVTAVPHHLVYITDLSASKEAP